MENASANPNKGSSDRGLLAICLIIAAIIRWFKSVNMPGYRQPPGQLPRSQALSQLHTEMRYDLYFQ